MNQKIKFILILIGFLILGFAFYFLLSSKSKFQNPASFYNSQKTKEEKIAFELEKYKNDNFGGNTPLETYQLFLDALKKEDIELAVKYFPVELQEKYLNLFKDIKKSGQWEKMMKDLLDPKNQIGEFINTDWYNIKVKNDRNEVVTTVTLRLIKDFEGKPVNNIWKIVEF